MDCASLAYAILLWLDDRENMYFILSVSLNRKYESLAIIEGYVMKQWYTWTSILGFKAYHPFV